MRVGALMALAAAGLAAATVPAGSAFASPGGSGGPLTVACWSRVGSGCRCTLRRGSAPARHREAGAGASGPHPPCVRSTGLPRRQNNYSSAARTCNPTTKAAVHIGGSARGYLPGFAWLAAPLWSNARAAVRMFMHRRPRGERPHLPLGVQVVVQARSSWGAGSQR
jgi:hypothetical protein